MFHFVLLSGGAILIGRSYPSPSPHPPLVPSRTLVLRPVHLPTLLSLPPPSPPPIFFFLYYNVRALSGGSDGSGAEAGLTAGCRLERVPGWDCFSNELHSSGLCVSVWGTPPLALTGSFPPRARENLFFSPSFFFRPFSSSPPLPLPSRPPRLTLFPPRRGFRWRIILVNGHPRMLHRDLRQVIIEYL